MQNTIVSLDEIEATGVWVGIDTSAEPDHSVVAFVSRDESGRCRVRARLIRGQFHLHLLNDAKG